MKVTWAASAAPVLLLDQIDSTNAEARRRAEGVAADGALRLRLADGTLRLISAGDVFFGEAA